MSIAENEKTISQWVKETEAELRAYRAIGTVSEFRELKEKATTKKKDVISCPICGGVAGSWSKEKE